MLHDIIEINGCHLFLGRPWHYDCRDMHDCVKNVFSIEKGGRKHSLIPLKNKELDRRNLIIGHQVELKDCERDND